MKTRFRHYAVLLMTLAIVPALASCDVYRKMQDGKTPNYELGTHAGAEACAECHEQQYEEWSNNSAHAIATVKPSFLDFKEKFTGVAMFDLMMGEDMCYACHGGKAVNQGVNCETCHGVALADDEDFEKTHEVKYTPGMARMRREDFCRSCHTMSNPITNDPILSLYGEWERSRARKDGLTCQGCHMKRGQEGEAYHGFDSLSRKAADYDGSLEIRDIAMDFPRFRLTVVNRVSGHAIPAAGPSRIMGLALSFRDPDGREVHRIQDTFGKYYDLMPVFGVMPYRLIRNTQLQSGEARRMTFELPAGLRGRIGEVVIRMRFYDVSDIYQGDIEKAHSVSRPILERRVAL